MELKLCSWSNTSDIPTMVSAVSLIAKTYGRVARCYSHCHSIVGSGVLRRSLSLKPHKYPSFMLLDSSPSWSVSVRFIQHPISPLFFATPITRDEALLPQINSSCAYDGHDRLSRHAGRLR
jgi:hypothetical protein